MFRCKKKAKEENTEKLLSRVVSRYVIKRRTRKLSKKDLEIKIDGQSFEFIDMPLKNYDRTKKTSN